MRLEDDRESDRIMTKEERFRELYWKYHRLILHIAYERVRDCYIAQDICQEVFLKMLRKLNLSAADENIRAWLVVVTDHAAKDVLKKGGKYGAPVSNGGEYAADDSFRYKKTARKRADCEDDPVERFLRKELSVRILEHLRMVSEEQYEIVVLICCMQMSVAEAAARLGMSYDRLTMKLHRARKWIREQYGAEYEQLKY